MKRASDTANCSLVISEYPMSSMKINCSPADSQLRTISTCVNNTISLWNLEDKGCRLVSSEIVQNPRTAAALRVDAMSLGSFATDSLIACGNNDLSLQVYNNRASQKLRWNSPNAHDSYINDLKFLYSSSAEFGIVSCADDQTIRVWDVNSDSVAVEYKTRSTPVSIATHKDMPDQFWVAEIDGAVKLYDKSSSSPICSLSSASKLPFHQMDWNNQAVNMIGGTDRGKWYLWDWKAGKIFASGGTLCEATGFHWSFSQRNLFTVNSSSEALIWDTDHLGVGCSQLHQKSRIHDVTWLGDNACCVVASGGNLIFWNIVT